MHDVCILGAGPAGLNAALILGRCGRDVLVFDSGKPRNGVSRALHGFLSRDGTPPLELRALGRAELDAYPTVHLRQSVEVCDVSRHDRFFKITTTAGEVVEARIVLLATGRIDLIPDQPGFREYYGLGVYHCAYCDGWENRGKPLVAHGAGESGWGLALDLLNWSKNVTLCTDGPNELPDVQRKKLERNGVQVIEHSIEAIRGSGGSVAAVTFRGREELPCHAVFFCAECVQKSPFAETLGCQLDESGSVICQGHAATNVPGLYVAGNVRGGVHLAIVAAAEGAAAGMAINSALHEADLR
jgi:thioredoxin reductase